MHTTKISIELYEVYHAADAIASKLYYGLPVTEELMDDYRKVYDRWYSTFSQRVTIPGLPDRCREEGV